MSALWRINLWVIGFFSLVTAACLWLLLHQAVADVDRELIAAQAVVQYLSDTAEQQPAALQPRLSEHLRHVRVIWLAADEPPHVITQSGADALIARWLFPAETHAVRVLNLSDGRRVQLGVDPSDEIDEVWDSLQQLLLLCGLALVVSLSTIRWAVCRGMHVLDNLLKALQQVSRGELHVRLPLHGNTEAQQLAGHFNRMTATLEHTEADNRRLTQALLAVQDQERTRLAQTLHDDLGQYLAGIRAQACLLRMVADQSDVVRSTALGLEANCEQLQLGFRALIRDLYPVVLQHLPLPEAMTLLAEHWRSAHGIECVLLVDPQLPELTPAARTHLYRLLQEALTNVVRHANASQVRVSLRRLSARLVMEIRDNGCGAMPPQRPGVGLYSMRERARCLRGELHIETQPGAGWTLALNIPLEA
ncbi:histidine kinase [Pseudomonas syringae]|uniref:histidine kinase n=1 Tax=Pseudomonas syringae TaxID=317 RepID=A0A1C7Z6H5_PSESX|nr:ATP-binding protein [Pseudomonas syringae]OCR24058.1 histidine kinase [Pseudomonas syringae]